jgi:NIPSNAP
MLPILNHRVYTIQVRKMGEFLAVFDKLAMPVQLRHLRPPIYTGVSEIGALNQFVHVWEYASFADFETRVQARNSDPEWPAYIQASIGLITAQEDRIIRRHQFKTIA